MEGLIKGLLDVALGGDQDNDRRGRREEDPPRDREDRSRFTWSEVVSGDDREDDGNRRPPRNNRNDQDYQGGRDEALETAGSRRPPPRKAIEEGYRRHEDEERQDYTVNRWNRQEEEPEGKQDGWETVGRKPHKQQHKVGMDQWNQYKKNPSEQEYAEDFKGSESLEPSREELNDLSRACSRLWELDCNRLLPGKDYQIDCGEGKKVYQKEDMAQGRLFSWLDEDVFRRPTMSRFLSLLDNYNPNQGSKEVVTTEEMQEQAAFIEEISRTAPIKYLHKYLAAKGIVSGDFQDFKRRLKSLWFDLYGRGGTSGCSSAFEHVFVGEIKQRGEQEVSGFHNWLQFYLEEAKGRVDYQGYIFPRRRGQILDSETQLLTIQFEWNGVLKSVSSTLVGVSPEFEVALYTLCYYAGEEDNHVELGPYPVNIKCYRLGERIGSVFPIAES